MLNSAKNPKAKLVKEGKKTCEQEKHRRAIIVWAYLYAVRMGLR